MVKDYVFEQPKAMIEFAKANSYNEHITYFDPTKGWILRNEQFTSDEDNNEGRRIR
jgi:hypothetical protein